MILEKRLEISNKIFLSPEKRFFVFLAIIALVVCHVTSFVASRSSDRSIQDHSNTLPKDHTEVHSSLENELEGLKVSFQR